ncbi:hypothetical protein PIROE2DRAFT_1981 [Piromyces sp. E2]|nr:hypothetical protein PIROE2DRAFT_1981 [Piromyces sp. E2]|eukprot:OUM70032.1 hypothetical protein PIROE2DRAFT_1981 [Piromyces sp. E2]
MDAYDENNNKTRYHLTFNYDTNLFNEYQDLLFTPNVQVAIICSDEDIDKSDEEKKIVVIWNVSTIAIFYSSAIFITAFPHWYNYQKNNGKTFCLRIDAAGWDRTIRIDNKWIAVPLSSEFRIFRYNKKTFDYCNKQGYNIHYPPPVGDKW